MVDILVNNEGKAYTINGLALKIESNGNNSNNVNLTVRLNKGSYTSNAFNNFIINGNTYTQSDFTNNVMTIQIPANTPLPWTASMNSVYANSGEYTISPSSGTINTNTDTSLTINIWNNSPADEPGINDPIDDL